MFPSSIWAVTRDGDPGPGRPQTQEFPSMLKNNALFRDIKTITSLIPRPRRRQFMLLVCLMVMGALADTFTLGAIVPFISIMSDPAAFTSSEIGGYVAPLVAGMTLETQMLLLTGIFITTLLVAGLLRAVITWSSGRFAMRVGQDLGNKVYSNIVRQDYSFHLNTSSSKLLAAVQKIQVFPQNVLVPATQAITSLVTSLFIITALLIINLTMALSALAAVVILYGLVVAVFNPIQRRNSFFIARIQPEKARLVQEGVGGARDIIINDLSGFYERLFDKVEHGLRSRFATNLFLAQVPRYFVETTMLVLVAVVVYLAAANTGDISSLMATAAAFALGLQRILPSMQMVYRGWAQISSNAGSMEIMVKYLELEPPPVSTGADAAISFERDIRLSAMDFSYSEDAKPVLKGLNLTIARGEFIGLTGRTGSGKSTLVDIIMGLHLPTGGEMLIDGVALSQVTLADWRRRIAHVPQAVFLVEGSIRENIALGVNPQDVDEALLAKVVELAELEPVVAALDAGLETTVGERGARLSGGQRQRIGIARALYLSREILVLDEATSALDEATQTRVMANIRSSRAGMTVVAIAHRLETLTACDRIIRLDRGKIAA